MSKFKIGDKCVPSIPDDCGSWVDCGKAAHHIVITEVLDDYYCYNICDSKGMLITRCSQCFGDGNLTKITTKTTMTSITEKFISAITPEPQKSFRKAGITNGDNLLTEEGQRIFLSWLLTQNADAFKTQVVDALLASDKTA